MGLREWWDRLMGGGKSDQPATMPDAGTMPESGGMSSGGAASMPDAGMESTPPAGSGGMGDDEPMGSGTSSGS
jgi:hypothetical protein